MSKVQLSVSEIVATIKASNSINIVIEGLDDAIAYRQFEATASDKLGVTALILPTGGRSTLLAVYDSLQGTDALNRCYFICDMDFWLFTGIPQKYINYRIITTDGYSIENDIFRDYPIDPILTADEATCFRLDLEIFTAWFAYAIDQKLAGADITLSTHVNEIIDRSTRTAAHGAPARSSTARTLHQKIAKEHSKYLRGKSYLALFIRQLSAPKRRPKHSAHALFEHAAAARGILLRRIENLLLSAIEQDLSRYNTDISSSTHDLGHVT